ncbi:hypothetical protein CPC08DRAFT_639629 [Agrocybe pediades]|nr:hypothetical protein CPC08DRAFT_639629 [Agrocybe pediades]
MTTINESSAPARRLQAVASHTSSASSSSQRDHSRDVFLLTLSDGGKISYRSAAVKGEKNEIIVNDSLILTYTISETQSYALEVTSVGTRFHGATTHIPKYPLLTISSPLSSIAIPDFWAAIYALFTLYKENEHIPFIFGSFANADEIRDYLITTGLARAYPKSELDNPTSKHIQDTKDILFLSRSSFWQGAGTTGFHRRSWLLNPREPFPYQPSFTRNEKVIASHPLRPSKPQPGEILYRRWCTHVNQSIEITFVDLEGIHDGSRSPDGISRHLAAFHKWHNDERVNKAWGEAGSLEAHRKYLETVLADPHVLPCMFSWDGELSGYIEIVYTKEDHVAQHYPNGVTPGDWDRGIHVLVGESKFLGRERSEIWMRSLIHYIFLTDPRTNFVIGEPDHGNQPIARVAEKAGFHMQTVIDFPYKRSALNHNPREKFFKLCRLW